VDYDFEGEVRAEWEQLLESVGMFPVDEVLYLVVESKEAMVDYYNELVKKLGVGLLLNIIGSLSKNMSEGFNVDGVELFDGEYVDMGAVKCKYGKSCILPSEVCSEVDSYKDCEMYETMVYMKAEYEKIGVYDMFVD